MQFCGVNCRCFSKPTLLYKQRIHCFSGRRVVGRGQMGIWRKNKHWCSDDLHQGADHIKHYQHINLHLHVKRHFGISKISLHKKFQVLNGSIKAIAKL